MELSTVVTWLLSGLGAVVFAVVVVGVGELVVRLLRSRRPGLMSGWQRSRLPLGLAVAFSGLRLTWRSTDAMGEADSTVLHALLIGAIIGWIWLVGSIVLALIDLGLRRTSGWARTPDDHRRMVTQLQLIRRLVILFFVVVGIGGVLLTFPGVDRLGGGILASAGLLSVIAGLAAQTSLANMFAGIQMTFSQAVRIGDTVVVEEEFGVVEDLTLTYVVIRIWDGRRLVLPTTYFATKPYTNWTRQGTAVVGTVYLHVDWRLNVPALRDHLLSYLQTRPEWDGKAGGLVVTDAVDGRLEVRASVSAANADDVWVLRCAVREELVAWIRDQDPNGMLAYRVRDTTGAPPAAPAVGDQTPDGDPPPPAG